MASSAINFCQCTALLSTKSTFIRFRKVSSTSRLQATVSRKYQNRRLACFASQDEVSREESTGGYRVPSWVTNGSGLLISTSCFALLTADLYNTRFMADGPDMAAHQWVLQNIPHETSVWWNKVGSNIPLNIAVLVSAAAFFGALLQESKRGKAFRALGISTMAFFLAAGRIPHSDPALIKFVKDTVHRARPSPELTTFSFPSGHTTAAAFGAGLMLWVFLPLLFSKDDTNNSAEEVSDLKGSSAPDGNFDGVQFIIWTLITGSTAAGRVLADVHWVSDTLAGASFGFTIAALTAIDIEWLESALKADGEIMKAADDEAENKESLTSNRVGDVKPTIVVSEKSKEIEKSSV